MAVGCWYEELAPTTDDEVQQLLNRAAHERATITTV
jgi:predicted phosphoribosyltransferase